MQSERTGQDMVVAVPNAAVDSFGERNPAGPVISQAIVENDEAFGRLIQMTSPVVYRFLARMVRSPEDALDLTQEVYLAAHRSRARLRVGSPALPYLLTIARRKAISLLRWRVVRSVVQPLSDTNRDAVEDRALSPRDEAADRQRVRAIESALAKLKPTERAAVILRLFEERPYEEIAQVMGKPVGTVKSLVFRAERKMRTHLTAVG